MKLRLDQINFKIFKITIISLISISIIISSCNPGNFLTELNRCLFINLRIDQAKQELDNLDTLMAEAHNYQVFEVDTLIYDFEPENGQTLKTMITYPKNRSDVSPVIIFSHGLSGSAESQLFLTRGLARRGNIVIAPDHIDAFNSDRIGLLDQYLTVSKSTDIIRALNFMIESFIQSLSTGNIFLLLQLSSYSDEELQALADRGELLGLFDQHFSYRVNDINFILNQLNNLNENDPVLKNKLDLDKLVMAGHSLGGGTALRFAIEENPFQAFICLSPAAQQFSQSDLALINKPVLYMSGNLDVFHDRVFNAFEDTPVTKMFLSIHDGGHIIFTDRNFLYGLGLPFLSDGEVGFTDNLPFAINDPMAKRSLTGYPEELHDFQGKVLTINKTVNAFIDLYVNNNQVHELISSLEDDSLVEEFIFTP